MTEDAIGADGEDIGLGPVAPTPETHAEIIDFIRDDQSRLGEVFRGLERGLNADEIASELGVATSGFVWNQSRMIQALTRGDLPTAPTLALVAARTFRRFLKSKQWSPPTHRYLERNIAELDRRATDEAARTVEVQQAKEQTQRAESQNQPGVYVYALPHYLRYPYDERTGRTLMKVGRSDRDVIMRFRDQTRTTALPEEPILLRIYRTEPQSAAQAEERFHRLLEAADHNRSVARTAGREWFVTSTRFLDEVARTLSLPVDVVNEAEVSDDE
jgi:hypothetical protein